MLSKSLHYSLLTHFKFNSFTTWPQHFHIYKIRNPSLRHLISKLNTDSWGVCSYTDVYYLLRRVKTFIGCCYAVVDWAFKALLIDNLTPKKRLCRYASQTFMSMSDLWASWTIQSQDTLALWREAGMGSRTFNVESIGRVVLNHLLITSPGDCMCAYAWLMSRSRGPDPRKMAICLNLLYKCGERPAKVKMNSSI